ncbi:E3 ubiquitin-protein ligase RNF4-like [Ochlerotatus camptorhynchus]|uniref:E3 ubiquitin-protein ligase RNF4-like n=1 Tax=Ochlerotatus camptorhynchus TaxID=644619 RepID=UPI0031D8BD1C
MDSSSENLDESMLDVIQRAEAFIMAHSFLNREAKRSSSNIFDVSGNDASFHSAADKSAIADDSESNMIASGPSTSGTSDSDGNQQTSNASSDHVEVLSDDSNATLPYELNALRPEADDNADCVVDNDDCVVIEVPHPVVDLCSPMHDEIPLSPATRRARRRRADAALVVESINLDDTVINIAPPAQQNAIQTPPPTKRMTTIAPRSDSISTEAASSISATCPICLESIFHQQAASTVCGHLFCNACITQEIQIRKKCPMCKRALKRQHVHPIYFN